PGLRTTITCRRRQASAQPSAGIDLAGFLANNGPGEERQRSGPGMEHDGGGGLPGQEPDHGSAQRADPATARGISFEVPHDSDDILSRFGRAERPSGWQASDPGPGGAEWPS